MAAYPRNPPRSAARLHILRAHHSPRAVIIRRKPSKLFHVIAWDTTTDELTPGSWFRGRLYPFRSDLSWDGEWMVYMAYGANGDVWSGVCQPPWLRSAAHCPLHGTWGGGGYFSSPRTLRWSDGSPVKDPSADPLPLDIQDIEEDPILGRFRRDGWVPPVEGSNDRRWRWRPTPQHPELRMYYVHTTAEFELENLDLLDETVDWATWSAKGDLLVARNGTVERWQLTDLERGVPGFVRDLEDLEPPPRQSDS